MKKYCILAILLLITACTGQVIFEEPSVLLSINKDKDLYKSGEIMNITVNIDTNMEGSAKVRVYGIYSGTYRLDQSKETALVKGVNTVNFEYKAPACNTCSGIKAGTYDITAELIYANAAVANASTKVEIRQ